MKEKVFAYYFLVFILSFSGFVYGAIPAAERAALIALYNSTDGDNWTNNNGWKTLPLDTDGFAMPGTEGDWYGITVSGDHVYGINLQVNQLNGSIPSELGALSNLQILYLHQNKLSGSIPSELGNLSNVIDIALPINQLTGSIPPELGNLSNLIFLTFDGNQLTGSIPPELGNLSNLVDLHIADNQLTGNIPPELGNLSNLTDLVLWGNQLTGSIPSELGNLSKLRYLILSSNEFVGTIPPGLGNLSNLIELILWGNQLTGSIPPVLGNLSNLEWFSLNSNLLSGPIPTSLKNLTKLSAPWVNLGHNCLFSTDSDLRTWLNKVDPDWESNQNHCSSTLYYFLNIKSSPETNVDITVTPKDSENLGNGSTNFTRAYYSGTNLTLTAPSLHSGRSFQKWLVDNAQKTNRTITITMNADHIAKAVYEFSTYTLTVQSSPDKAVPITVNPTGNNGLGNGSTDFIRTYNSGSIVTLEAPSLFNSKNFLRWIIDGSEDSNRSTTVTMNKNHTVQAVYQSSTYTLTVQSTPYSGVGITVTPLDNDGNGDGNSNFTRTYDSGEVVSLTAPSSANGSNFIKWTISGQDNVNTSAQVTMEGNQTAVAYYETSSPPEIAANRVSLNMGYIIGSSYLPQETFTVYNSGGGTLNWSISTDMTRLSFSPASGGNYEAVEVSIDTTGLIAGKFRGVAYVTDPLVSNSPVEIEIKLWVKDKASQPFGNFATPVDNSTVSSSIPATGWALGDTGIESVKIYREEGAKLVYIGDATFVEGARPDVEAIYSDYPMNYKAGWGYMLLTHFLPNGGNGSFKLHAIATDKEDLTTDLGTKTIHVDNANAVKPFGAIDTPTQGGTASGNQFINWGWVLTPQPNSIPTDGSTIDVWVDSVNIGNPTYNLYREDIANLFPGYANSDGANGYYYLDTTAYANGVHTIQWTTTDSGGNTDGIGSRYFTIQNTGGTSGTAQSSGTVLKQHSPIFKGDIPSIPINHYEPVGVLKGSKHNSAVQPVYPGEDGTINIEIKELQRIALHLFARQCRPASPLPIGSTFDSRDGVFYWQPGPGFYGDYQLDFIKQKGLNRERVRVKIKIVPMNQ